MQGFGYTCYVIFVTPKDDTQSFESIRFQTLILFYKESSDFPQV